jgi:hypothetical protein
MPRVNIHPRFENSPNLVTLTAFNLPTQSTLDQKTTGAEFSHSSSTLDMTHAGDSGSYIVLAKCYLIKNIL